MRKKGFGIGLIPKIWAHIANREGLSLQFNFGSHNTHKGKRETKIAVLSIFKPLWTQNNAKKSGQRMTSFRDAPIF